MWQAALIGVLALIMAASSYTLGQQKMVAKICQAMKTDFNNGIAQQGYYIWHPEAWNFYSQKCSQTEFDMDTSGVNLDDALAEFDLPVMN